MRLDPRAKLLWRLTGALQALSILLGGALGSYVLSSRAPFYLTVLPVLGALALAVLLVFVFPPVLWWRWGFEIWALGVDLQRGVVGGPTTPVPQGRGQDLGNPRGTLIGRR